VQKKATKKFDVTTEKLIEMFRYKKNLPFVFHIVYIIDRDLPNCLWQYH